MLIDHTPLYNEVWDRVERELRFWPHVVRSHDFQRRQPFVLPGEFAVCGIEDMDEARPDLLEEAVREILISAAEPGERLYALDWQHSTFLYAPWNLEEQRSFFVKDEHFRFGCLDHPWRQEVWILGRLCWGGLSRCIGNWDGTS